MSDPRRAKDLNEAARRPDGLYDGFKAISWLSEVLHPGSGVREGDVRQAWADAVKGRRSGPSDLRDLAGSIAASAAKRAEEQPPALPDQAPPSSDPAGS